MKIQVQGRHMPAAATAPASPGTTVQQNVRLAVTRTEAQPVELDLAPQQLLEIETEDGDLLWIRGDEAAERLGAGGVLGRSAATGEQVLILRDLVLPPGPDDPPGTRDALTWAIDRVAVLDVSAPAVEVARQIEDANPDLGLHRWTPEGRLEPVDFSGQQDKPWLLFLHGTASSTLGSFGKLVARQPAIWQGLHKAYQGRIIAHDHRSLTEDPLQNALALLDLLPEGIELHLVSHSRGGLVGELLALGQIARRHDGSVFDQTDLAACPAEARPRLESLGKTLVDRGVKIGRFVRVACPARGTSLAGGRLDRWLNLVFCALRQSARLLGEAAEERVEDLGRLARAATASRDSPEALPGIAAMAPEHSPLLALLNRRRTLAEGATDALVVIAGDIQPSGALRKLAMWFADNFFDGDHDLVVNTAAMDGGIPRGPVPVLLDRGARVTHFNYFANDTTAGQVRDALLDPRRFQNRADSPEERLRRAEEADPRRGVSLVEQEGHTALAVIEDLSAPALLRGPAPPLAVILPGITGSHLSANGRWVWLNPAGICLGGVGRLAIDSPSVGPTGIIETYYGGLRAHLSRTHQPLPLAYDWRLPIQVAGAAVARVVLQRLGQGGPRPIHFIGHSMGGLVARAALCDPQLQRAFAASGESRLLMLGTPNGGSLAMALALLGHSRTIKALAALSLGEDRAAIAAIMRRWPGALQLLPPELLDAAAWAALAGNRGLDPAAVKAAREFWRLMQGDAGLPAGRCLYLAGMGQTCDRLYAVGTGPDGPVLHMTTTPRGDGTVLWSSGIPPGVPAWYAPSQHGDLCKDSSLHPVIAGLLLDGRTDAASVTRDTGLRGLEAPDIPRKAVPAEAELPLIPSAPQLLAMAMGGRMPSPAPAEAAPTEVRVRVVHGDLSHASHPILVGHNLGDPIRGAEQALDRQLHGRLARREALGLHPGLIGNWDVHLQGCAGDRCDSGVRGGIVVGLGVMSDLTTGALTATIRSGLLAYVDALRDLPAAAPTGAPDAPPRIGVSAVLVGSGAGVVSVSDSVSALLNAVEQANRILAGQQDPAGEAPRLAEVEIIEAVEQVAVTAWHAVGNRIPKMRDRFRHPERLIQGKGGFRRTGPEADPASWMEVTITAPDPQGRAGAPPSAHGPLHYLLVDGRARVEAETVATNRRLVRHYITQIPSDPGTADETGLSPGRTLFELLWPARLKQHSLEDRNLRLILDRESASIPWEMLDDRRPDEEGAWPSLLNPPAVRYGVLRQLVSQRDRPALPRRGGRRTALVIGDPRGGGSPLSPLPGAQQEAAAVASLLEDSGFTVTRLIGDAASPAQVVAALFSRSWSVVHVASHGVAGWQPRPEDPPMTGIVLGAPPLDVLEAPLLAQLPEPPDLVFLNCCHLGRISADGPFSGALRQDRPGFASSLAVELIERGCPAVVACGWAVQDDAAMRFAQGLFTELCAGADFGTAVRQARSATHAASAAMGSLDNTWGAYQCYGHPGFGLIDGRQERRAPQSDPASPAEALAEVRAHGSRLDILGSGAVVAQLSALSARIRENGWQGCSDLAAALGDAYAACGKLELAAECYGRAASAEIPTLPLTALQESAPLLNRSDDGKLRTAIALLETLNASCGASLRRHVLLADLHRQRAILAPAAKTRQEALKRLEQALDRALALAGTAQQPGARAETDRLRLHRLLAQALLSQPPKALESDFRQLSARMDIQDRAEPLLALVGAVVTGDPGALPSAAPDSLLPAVALALAALPMRSPLREALERLRDRPGVG